MTLEKYEHLYLDAAFEFIPEPWELHSLKKKVL